MGQMRRPASSGLTRFVVHSEHCLARQLSSSPPIVGQPHHQQPMRRAAPIDADLAESKFGMLRAPQYGLEQAAIQEGQRRGQCQGGEDQPLISLHWIDSLTARESQSCWGGALHCHCESRLSIG